jgi:hypothetical protein
MIQTTPFGRAYSRRLRCLLATAALGGDHQKLLDAEALLSESAQQNDPDQRIARVYAFLAEGDARAAHAEAERPAKYSDQTDAFLHPRPRGRQSIQIKPMRSSMAEP